MVFIINKYLASIEKGWSVEKIAKIIISLNTLNIEDHLKENLGDSDFVVVFIIKEIAK